MTQVVKIDNHTGDGLKRLLEQWKNKPNMEGFVRSLIDGMQELEEAFFDLCNKRLDVFQAEGEQLDKFGEIVGQERMGLDDDFYRILLVATIGINVSNGEPERVISVAKLMTQANFIHYMNIGAAEVGIGTDGVINPLTTDFLLDNLQRVVMGGVRVDFLCVYDPEEAFAIDGPNTETPGSGFGTVDDPLEGGKFGECFIPQKFFSFEGNNTSDKGFGSISDPLVGGVLIAL